ncbi:MAG TPA: LCP family protein [Lachnospiraceae bacterium]|nr:LCP family protein [Lachnospiraceae bacterium]
MSRENANGPVKRSEGTPRRTSKKKARKKRNFFIILTIEIFAICILGVFLWAVFQGTKTQKINIEVSANEGTQDYFDEVNDSTENGGGYMQVALFGVDSREGALDKNTRSDSIIIACVNNDTGDVKLVSIFRDTYLNLSNDSYNKCNGAYATGGPEQAVTMLNMNLDLNITNYVTVGFRGVVETIDSLGGVPIEISSAEIGYLNDYQYCIAEDLGISNYNKVSSEGLQTLDGLQACAYCRIRYTAGDDFRRAERQRTVLTQMSEQAKLANAATLTTIATNAFDNVVTNFDLDTILGVATNVSNYTVVGSEGFPFTDYRATGTIGGKGSCVIPTDLVTNVSMLHEFLFGTQNYDPTPTVHECSEHIAADTSPYL